ncbi:hypothetical protein [Rhodococcus pyridinivorans]|uniref:hypothetical protein n=1 Tax=Rhodococcus pyridinivorans TaxID=103816 RepID=UPI000BA214E4|nr:hypothetical protein [Rhodococcus pyridinivorans]
MIWTPEAIRALGPVTDLRTALKIAGIGTTYGYEKARSNELPFPVLRYGRVYKVPTAGLLKALGINDETPATA